MRQNGGEKQQNIFPQLLSDNKCICFTPRSETHIIHTSSFSDLIEAGKKLDVGVKLGRIEAPLKKKEGETSKRPIHQPHRPLFSRHLRNKTSDKIQEMINTKQIFYNEVKPPNVHANPLPDQGLGSGPSVNMISIAAIEEEEDAFKTSIPFVINYAPEEVAFASVPFVIEGPEPTDKGKAPAAAFLTIQEATPLPSKKVTDQEAEAFMKVIKILEIPNAFSLLLGRPWIHAAGAVPSSLHQKLKFFVEDYGEVGPSQADRMIGKVLLKNNYVPGTGLRVHAQGILRPIEMEEYRNRRGLGFRPSCHEIVQAHRGKHLHCLAAHYGKLSRGIPVQPFSQFFSALPPITGSISDSPITESDDFSSDAVEAFLALLAIYTVTEKTYSGVHIRPAQEDEELTNWTAVPLYSAMVVDV
ncbi:hypothetical protein CRG98_034591 [Punica granatum]|uniref:G-patch domain-containing protein n=1 Tax=Punica granatum TaxID=22663 RepID=A0A2I0ILY5_PUNGR|nr:hypothetical protein CRG98_034591 [Punica granatum]